MQETIELMKLAIEHSSPTVIILCVMLFLGFRAKIILYTILEFKDLVKKRLIQKYEQIVNFNEKNFLTSPLKEDYLRLCEESQIKALIGCQFCTKDIAIYILSRKNINNAINIYHRIKGDIEVVGVDIVPKNKMGSFRIKFNAFCGFIFYMIISMVAFSPILLPASSKLFNFQFNVNLDWKIMLSLGFYIVLLFSVALFVLYAGLKPQFVKIFCNLEEKSRI